MTTPASHSSRLQERLAAIAAPDFGTMTAREFYSLRESAWAGRFPLHEDRAICFDTRAGADAYRPLMNPPASPPCSVICWGRYPSDILLVRTFRGEDVRKAAAEISARPTLREPLQRWESYAGAGCSQRRCAPLPDLRSFPAQKFCHVVAALFAIVGHMFPVWLKFRGGKGVATGLGHFLAHAQDHACHGRHLHACWRSCFAYVSLGSIVAVALFLCWRGCCRTAVIHRSLALMTIACSSSRGIARISADSLPGDSLQIISSGHRSRSGGRARNGYRIRAETDEPDRNHRSGAWGTALSIVLGRTRRSPGPTVGARKGSARLNFEPDRVNDLIPSRSKPIPMRLAHRQS